MIPAVRYLENADSAVLREKPTFSPRSVSASHWTPSKILKKILSRDAEQFF